MIERIGVGLGHILSKIAGYRGDKRVLILGYHAVAEQDPIFPASNCLSPETFYRQVRFLSRNFHVIDLPSIPSWLSTKHGRRRQAVVLTFDDGHKSLATQVVPILREFGLPATLFVTIGFDRSRAEVAPMLRLYGLANMVGITAVAAAVADIEKQFVAPKVANLPNLRRSVELALSCDLAHPRARSLISEIEMVFGTRVCPSDLTTLSTSELKDLARQGRVSIGGHSVAHSNLRRLSRSELICDFQESLDYVQSIAPRQDAYWYAFPFGDKQSMPIGIDLSKLGWSGFLTAQSGRVYRGDTRFVWPRVMISQENAPRLGLYCSNPRQWHRSN